MNAPPNPPSRRPILPSWYTAVGGLLAILFVLFNLYYRIGASGISFGGASTSFEREHDHQLFKIDDRNAFLVHGEHISIVKYKGGLAPFQLTCGTYDLAGGVLGGADYRSGDWVYSNYPEFDGADAYNLRSGEVIELDVPRPQTGRVDPKAVPFFVQHGLTFDPALALTPERVAKDHAELSTMNESCVTFNAAFYLLFGLMFIAGIPLLAVGLVRRGRLAR
jgi:hypothetical protein